MNKTNLLKINQLHYWRTILSLMYTWLLKKYILVIILNGNWDTSQIIFLYSGLELVYSNIKKYF